MSTHIAGDPETAMGPRMGDIYTPIDPLPDYDDVGDDPNADDTLDDVSGAGRPEQPNSGANAPERPEMPAYDGDIEEQTPGHHEADREFQYDEEDVDSITR